MTFYGLADRRLTGSELGEVFEFFVTAAEAEAALCDVLRDEPEWVNDLGVVTIILPFSNQ